MQLAGETARSIAERAEALLKLAQSMMLAEQGAAAAASTSTASASTNTASASTVTAPAVNATAAAAAPPPLPSTGPVASSAPSQTAEPASSAPRPAAVVAAERIRGAPEWFIDTARPQPALFQPSDGAPGRAELIIDADNCADAINLLADRPEDHAAYDRVTVFHQKSTTMPRAAARFAVVPALNDAPEATDARVAFYCFSERLAAWRAHGTRVTLLSRDQLFGRIAEILASVGVPASHIGRLPDPADERAEEPASKRARS